jgi:hypothetical protein
MKRNEVKLFCKFAHIIAFALFAVVSTSRCAPPFAAPAIVTGPRVLALIADQSVVAPGATVHMTAVLGGSPLGAPNGTLTWSFCARPEQASTGIPLSSFGTFEPEQGCFTNNTVLLTQEVTGPTASFVVAPNLLQNDTILRTAFGNELSAQTRLTLAQSAGVALVVHLRWIVDSATTVDSFKRILVLPDGHNDNPPPPVVRINDRVIAASPSRTNELCTVQGMPLQVAPRSKLTLMPDTDESWAESFTVIDASGQAIAQREQAFRSWFSTAGTWDFGRARMPDVQPSWTAPSVAGTVTFWLVVRDGHGGTSACRWTLDVGP